MFPHIQSLYSSFCIAKANFRNICEELRRNGFAELDDVTMDMGVKAYYPNKDISMLKIHVCNKMVSVRIIHSTIKTPINHIPDAGDMVVYISPQNQGVILMDGNKFGMKIPNPPSDEIYPWGKVIYVPTIVFGDIKIPAEEMLGHDIHQHNIAILERYFGKEPPKENDRYLSEFTSMVMTSPTKSINALGAIGYYFYTTAMTVPASRMFMKHLYGTDACDAGIDVINAETCELYRSLVYAINERNGAGAGAGAGDGNGNGFAPNIRVYDFTSLYEIAVNYENSRPIYGGVNFIKRDMIMDLANMQPDPRYVGSLGNVMMTVPVKRTGPYLGIGYTMPGNSNVIPIDGHHVEPLTEIDCYMSMLNAIYMMRPGCIGTFFITFKDMTHYTKDFSAVREKIVGMSEILEISKTVDKSIFIITIKRRVEYVPVLLTGSTLRNPATTNKYVRWIANEPVFVANPNLIGMHSGCSGGDVLGCYTFIGTGRIPTTKVSQLVTMSADVDTSRVIYGSPGYYNGNPNETFATAGALIISGISDETGTLNYEFLLADGKRYYLTTAQYSILPTSNVNHDIMANLSSIIGHKKYLDWIVSVSPKIRDAVLTSLPYTSELVTELMNSAQRDE